MTLDKIAESAGLEHFSFHAMRHSFASRMLEVNVPAKVVQDILGHADVTLTLNTYSHVVGTTAHEQISKINDLFSKNAISEEKHSNPVRQPKSIQKRLAEDREQKKNLTDEIPTKNKSKNRDEFDL